MKMLLLGVLMSAATMSAQAVDFIVPSNTGGLGFIVQQKINDELEKVLSVNTVIAGHCAKGHRMFEKTRGSVVMVAYNGMISSGDCTMTIDSRNYYQSLFSGPVAVCARPDFDDPVAAIVQKKSVTVGLGGTDWPKSVVLDLNPNFKPVVYSSSGGLLKGFAAGDTDFIVTNLIRATNLVNAGHAICLATTSRQYVNGIPPAAHVFPKWNYNTSLTQIFAIVGRNLTKEQQDAVNKSVLATMSGSAMQDLLVKSGFTQQDNISIDQFVNSSHAWSIK